MLAAGAIAMLLAMPLGSDMGAIDHALMRVLPWLYALPPDLLRWTLLIVTAVLMVWAGKAFSPTRSAACATAPPT